MAAVNAVIYWTSNPIWLGGLMSIGVTFFFIRTPPGRPGLTRAFPVRAAPSAGPDSGRPPG